MLKEIAVKFLSWSLKREKLNNIEIVIRSDGNTVYKRDKTKEKSIEDTFTKVVNIDKITNFDNRKIIK